MLGGYFPDYRLSIPGPQFLQLSDVYLRPTVASPEEPRTCQTKSGSKHLKTAEKVKFIYQELPEDGAFITAQIGGNEVVYSVVLTKARNPPSHEDVESHFTGELSKR
jgi:hypothetical protein